MTHEAGLSGDSSFSDIFWHPRTEYGSAPLDYPSSCVIILAFCKRRIELMKRTGVSSIVLSLGFGADEAVHIPQTSVALKLDKCTFSSPETALPLFVAINTRKRGVMQLLAA